MSITFAAATARTASFGTYYEQVAGGPELNVSNVNGSRLLTLLGFTHEEDYYGGVVDTADFLGRVLTAQALLDIATDDAHGRPTVEDVAPGGMTWIECGTEPGYMADRLETLHEVAAWAQQRGLEKVVWC